MGRITMELLRKKSEHNEGEVHSLEELALHQEKLEKIELIDRVCRNLKILLLQNNAISKIENVGRLKSLEYLNLALNVVERIENLEGCESLKKLDLTLNFVAELTSVKSLSGLLNLEQLYLVGNPCHDFPGYRDYVVGSLPQLKSLDGKEITTTERIKALQDHEELERMIIKEQKEYFLNHEENKNTEPYVKDSLESTASDKVSNEGNEGEEEDDGEFWSQKTGNTPEVRKEMIRRLEKQDEMKKPKDLKKLPKPPRRLTTAGGKPLNINEPKISFSLHDECERSQLVLDLAIPKFMCTTLIDVDVQPFHVKVTVKGKIFQLVLPEEVRSDSSYAQRSQTTGHLIITMQKVYDTSTMVWHGGSKQEVVDLTSAPMSAGSASSKGKGPNHKSSMVAVKQKSSSKPISRTGSTDPSAKLSPKKSILKKGSELTKSKSKTTYSDVPPLV